MGAIALFQNSKSYIHEELLPVEYLGERKLSMIKDFLSNKGILTLSDVDSKLVSEFYKMVFSMDELSPNMKRAYASALETAVRVHLEALSEIPDLEVLKTSPDKKKKLAFYLLINHIHSFDEIDATLRLNYEEYLKKSNNAKWREYVKVMDAAKYYAIEKNKNDLRPHVLRFQNEAIYLAYHPDYEIASRFYYTQVKEPLFFDFSLHASEIIKHQVFNYLKYIVEEQSNKDTHYLLQRYITPLWHLYNYCVTNDIDDISLIMAPQAKALEEYVSIMSSYTCGNIVTDLRKFIFLTAPVINWDATAWYLDRINFDETRMNPARPFEAFYFDDVRITENLELLKHHIKYLLGLSTRLSIASIYGLFNTVKNFLFYCDENNILLTKMTKANLESYISFLYTKDVRPATINSSLKYLAKFINFLEISEFIEPLGFHFECYMAKEIYTHNDLSVSKADQNKIFSVLDQFPENIRLMFLNLWASGLRVNEVCALKGNAYLFDGSEAWLLIYQNKAKREKRIPIPIELYHMMKEYLLRNGIKSTDYIFSAPNSDGCFRAGTFIKKVKEVLDKNGISETYQFKSHGFRHTMATELYMGESNIQCIREYLGHASENMTRHYIDHLPNVIDKHNEDYFNSKTLSWK